MITFQDYRANLEPAASLEPEKTLESVCSLTLSPSFAAHNERERLACLSKIVEALEALEGLGLEAGAFGSALRPGEFFGGSDADLAAFLPDGSEPGAGLARAAKLRCSEIMRETPFDLVFLPTVANPAFGERVKARWMVSAAWIKERQARKESLLRHPFTFEDVLFIDQDRVEIAKNAARRLHAQAREWSDPSDLPLLASARSVSEGLCRIGDKCAKDVLRHFLRLCAPPGQSPALLPLLRLPAKINRHQPIASEELERAYWALRQSSTNLAQGAWRGEALREQAFNLAELGFLFAALLERDIVGFAREASSREEARA